MANIGSFKKVSDDYQGEIFTLSVQKKNVRIAHEPQDGNDKAPTHRVYVGRAEIGAAWPKQSKEGRHYLQAGWRYYGALWTPLSNDKCG